MTNKFLAYEPLAALPAPAAVGMVMRLLVGASAAALLAGCGAKTELEPKPGNQLPIAPYGANARPDADTLLQPEPQAAPSRQVELRRRSEEREDDPYDVPPQ